MTNDKPNDKPQFRPSDPRLQGWGPVRECLFQFHRQGQIRGSLHGEHGALSFWEHEGDICLAYENSTHALFIIRKNGQLYPTKFARSFPREERGLLWQFLCALRESPFETLTASGRSTGVCCVCGKELTNPESKRLGIGPVCGGRVRKTLQPSLPSLPTINLEDFE